MWFDGFVSDPVRGQRSNHLHGGVFFHSLQSHVAPVDPPPAAVCGAAQTDPVAVSSVVVLLRVVADELLDQRHDADDASAENKHQQPAKHAGASWC